jgi:hypothetical protein
MFTGSLVLDTICFDPWSPDSLLGGALRRRSAEDDRDAEPLARQPGLRRVDEMSKCEKLLLLEPMAVELLAPSLVTFLAKWLELRRSVS